ncbi:TerC family protein [Janibacter terrae]|uniref:TerC family protein n=1 Tax=Janibacter terrae TaxID=103817 RepID=A0ABZ2FJQ6_9MICO|nr:TerC family protein [Janibacter terrae]MBA4083800.1 TerC family protein [Kytococcus sp.]HBO55330.1 TerC family protein [Janibacter terrae]HCE60722.1 TerC family protein [Janibacter terrae]
MDVPTWAWLLTLGVAAAVLLFDVIWVARNPHVPSTREVATILSIYVSAAVLFGIGLWLMEGGDRGTEFFAGWLTEYSLSVDNLFIFIIIMAKFGVPARFQQTALLWGIIIAIVLRTIFIFVGAAAINQFAWVFYIFGAFLIYTAFNLATESHDEEDEWEPNAVIKWFQRTVPSTTEWAPKLFTKENGKRVATPLFIVVIALGMTDLLFALDSIPAIYGLTKEPYIVLTANLFALMGLRQLYFLIGGLLKKLVYMSLGLSVLLAFIGVKLILHALHENTLPFINGGEHVSVPEISTLFSLGAIVLILGVTTVASLWKSNKDAKEGIGSDH